MLKLIKFLSLLFLRKLKVTSLFTFLKHIYLQKRPKRYQLSGHFSVLSKDYMIVENAFVPGGSRFIFTNSEEVFHLDVPNRKTLDFFLTDDEINKRALVDFSEDNTATVSITGQLKKKLKGTSVSLVSINTSNIYHVLFEGLSIVIFAKVENIQIDNIIISKNTHPKFIALIKRICSTARLIKLDNKDIVQANLLVSTITHRQHHWSRKDATNTSRNRRLIAAPPARLNINEELAQRLRQELAAIYTKRPTISSKNCEGKKLLFFTRRATHRITINEQDILKELSSYTEARLEVIEPSKMSFRELYKKINNADVILCQTGAALTNIMFAQEPKTIISWLWQGEGQNTDLFQDMANALGHDLYFISALSLVRVNGGHSHLLDKTQGDLFITPQSLRELNVLLSTIL